MENDIREEDADGVNERWVEVAMYHFERAKEGGNYEACRKIIADINTVSLSSAKVLEEELLETKVMNFV